MTLMFFQYHTVDPTARLWEIVALAAAFAGILLWIRSRKRSI